MFDVCKEKDNRKIRSFEDECIKVRVIKKETVQVKRLPIRVSVRSKDNDTKNKDCKEKLRISKRERETNIMGKQEHTTCEMTTGIV